MWGYHLNGNVVARVRRPDDELPYVGMQVCMVGRLVKPGTAENFVVSSVDIEARNLDLEHAQ